MNSYLLTIKTVILHQNLPRVTSNCTKTFFLQGDKYQLKFHAAGAGNAAGEKAPTSDKRLFHSPIIKFNTMLVR